MVVLRLFLLLATVVIFSITIYAVSTIGINWPEVFIGDLLNAGWRSQFNTDLLIHLCLLATWICWREGFTPRGYLFGFLSIVMGGMFGFPYLLIATYKAKGDPKQIMLGEHATK
jgi:hypothetical protein